MKKLTKAQALKYFRKNVAPVIRELYGRGDRVAMAEEWSNFTDTLREDGRITAHQDRTWKNPF